jgi:hypothetical protein
MALEISFKTNIIYHNIEEMQGNKKILKAKIIYCVDFLFFDARWDE